MKGLIDSTLREGAQMVSVSFSQVDKRQIISRLIRMGIEEIEIAIATDYDDSLRGLISYARSINSDTRISLWSPCAEDNIRYACSLCPDLLSLSIPGSDLFIMSKLEKSHSYIIDKVTKSISLAKGGGIRYVSLGIEDATRADPAFLKKLICRAAEAGVSRIRLADTVGISTPLTISNLISDVRLYFSADIGVHMHNDFGMATANTVSALEAGADYADVTTLGIGERAGNAKLEEVAGFLSLTRDSHYRLKDLKPLASMVAALSGQNISRDTPIIGDRIFHCKSSLHIQGLKKNPSTYEPYDPSRVGLKRRFVYGAMIGRKEVLECLENAGVPLPMNQLKRFIRYLRSYINNLNRPLPYSEFYSLVVSAHGSFS